ncbi:MAG: hypothetical protein R3B54_07695 [Bdellovibrionota bacterium]
MRQTVPLSDLESGNWISVRFGDFVVQHDAASVVATVRIKLLAMKSSGDFELRLSKERGSVGPICETDSGPEVEGGRPNARNPKKPRPPKGARGVKKQTP